MRRRSKILYTVKGTISQVLSRVLRVIEPVIQTVNTSAGAIANQSYTVLLRDAKASISLYPSFSMYLSDRMAVSDAAAAKLGKVTRPRAVRTVYVGVSLCRPYLVVIL
jgi:hypothetical protein